MMDDGEDGLFCRFPSMAVHVLLATEAAAAIDSTDAKDP